MLETGIVPAAARGDPVQYGPYARFLGGEFEPQPARPGDVLKTTLYWAAEGQFDKDYSVFVQAIGPNGRPVAQDDSWPNQGAYPTRLWQPGQVVADTHELAIPESTEAIAPALLPLVAGFYRLDTGERLAGRGANGDVATASLGSLRLLPARPLAARPASPLAATFGNQIQLLGYTLTPAERAERGQPLQITLYWQAPSQIAEDANIVLELRAADGQLRIIEVGAPRNGSWPASAWEPGDTVEDVHKLDIPLNMPAGPAQLWVGLNGRNGARLPVSGTAARSEDGAIYLQDVVVR